MLHRCSIAFGRRHLGHRTSKSLSLRDSRGALPTLSRTVLISPRYCDDSHGWPRWPGCNLLTTTFVLLTMRKLAVVTEVAAAKAEISAWSLLQYEIQVSCFEHETEYPKRLLQENEHNMPTSTISRWTVQERSHQMDKYVYAILQSLPTC